MHIKRKLVQQVVYNKMAFAFQVSYHSSSRYMYQEGPNITGVQIIHDSPLMVSSSAAVGQLAVEKYTVCGW